MPHSAHRRFLLPLAAWLLATAAWAAEPPALTCYSTAFEPFVIEQADGRIDGIDVEVIRELAVRIGQPIDIRLMPWLRLEQAFRSGQRVACGFSYSRTDERQAYLQYTQVPLHTTQYVLFYRRSVLGDWRGLASLAGRTVAVNRGFRRPPAFDQALRDGQFRLFEVTQDSQSLQMLQRGRIDAVLANADVGHYLIRKLQLDADISASPPLESMPTFLVFARQPQYAELAQRVDAALAQMLADGSYQRILARYRLPAARP